MRITMIGSGYVGLVSGACFAELGATVTCVDKDRDRIERLKAGDMPIYEPGLAELVKRNSTAGRLAFTTSLAAAVPGADAAFIAVGTPSGANDGRADLSFVRAAAREIAASLDGYTVVVTKSTVPVGTGREVERIIHEANPAADFDIASNPEFLREGAAIRDFLEPDRVVIGTGSERARSVMRQLYKPLQEQGALILFVSVETAELTKYAANSFLATKIAFINQIADLCEKVGANVLDVAKGIGLDSRIGSKFLQPGPGYGGSCFPKDTLALVATAVDARAPQSIVEAVVAANERRKKAMAGRVIDACGGSLGGKTVAVLGLTFKPDTDDMRDAPSLEIVPALQAAGATVRAYDPEGMDEARKLLDGVTWCADAWDALTGSDAAVVITEWAEFRQLDRERMRTVLAAPVVIDLRNIYDPEEMANAGFSYHSIGRPPVDRSRESGK